MDGAKTLGYVCLSRSVHVFELRGDDHHVHVWPLLGRPHTQHFTHHQQGPLLINNKTDRDGRC